MLDYPLALQWLLIKKDRPEESCQTLQVNENHTTNSAHCSHGFEVQISEEEADLFKHMAHCKKNPSHLDFIPIREFRLDHLPEAHRDHGLYDFIKTLGDMTVRVSVNRKKLGSGRVFNVCKYVDGQDAHGCSTNIVTCPCHKCQESEAPSNVWWELHVETAEHVIHDSYEASRTNLRFFYDDENSPPVALDNLTLKQVNEVRDRCHIKGITCDKDLGSRLERLNSEVDQLWTKVYTRYSAIRNSDTFNRLTIIVSHPHGCAKTVTLGHLKTVTKVAKDQICSEYHYTTSTCSGSSGAYVFILGHSGLRGAYQPVHHGISKESGLNSCIGWVLGRSSMSDSK